MRTKCATDFRKFGDMQQNYKGIIIGSHFRRELNDVSLNMSCTKEPQIIAAEDVKRALPRNAGNALDSDYNYEHYDPSVRLLCIRKTITGSCGFHLTRTKWDPYPWVSAVDAHTAAEMSGLKAGDCVLEVNGEDVLGLRIADIAKLVQAKSGQVTLLLWNCGSDFECEPERLCCAPMPRTLQRLATIVQSILNIIECPVCLDTITPPAMQCQNGHLLCLNCRIRAEKCPVCRDRYTPQRALIAEKIYAAITSAYNLCSTNEDKLRQKLFGAPTQKGGHVMSRRWRRAEAAKQTIDDDDGQQAETEIDGMQAKKRLSRRKLARTQQNQSQHVAPGGGQPGRFSFKKEAETVEVVEMSQEATGTDASRDVRAVKHSDKNKKILMKLWHRKAASMENLSTKTKASRGGELHDRIIDAGSDDNGLTPDGTTTPTIAAHAKTAFITNTMRLSTNRTVKNATNEQVEQVKGVMKNSKDHSTWCANNGNETEFTKEALTTTATPPPAMPMNCTTTMKTILNTAATNDVAHVNAMSKLLSATTPTTNDLSAMTQPHAPFPQRLPGREDNGIAVADNVKNSHKQQHVQPHLQLSTWPEQYLSEQNNIAGSVDTPTPTPTPTPTSPVPTAIAVERRCPSWLRSPRLAQSKFKHYNSSSSGCTSCSCPSSSLLFVDKRRPARYTPAHSLEYFNNPGRPSTATAATSMSSVDSNDSTGSRKTSTSSGSNSNGNGDINCGSDIVDSTHYILTPASSLSSGVFPCLLESPVLAAAATDNNNIQKLLLLRRTKMRCYLK
ncbi:PREDICTED: uncharacterized protein LOC108375106 isoform X1 [Rhagoletis zephyria]|uniref:uncharacterized protein LOC108375106 isoform X1 n=1 Tax=Rhagoletis zephyria TaxID=28612 RepID=UPI00081147F7|nr:PREDICTED: uncharacterized protein LOC108375106 isoform X1 [Rhagoletis zephyria]